MRKIVNNNQPPKNEIEAEAEHWRHQRDSFLNGISERTRTMALGALVTVWGLFTGKDHGMVTLSPRSSRALLFLALGAVLVLVLDFVEYAFGYQAARRKIPGEKVRPCKFNYDQWKHGLLWVKQTVGCATLVALAVLLTILLNDSICHAQTADQAQPYVGYWCGNDPNGNNWMGIRVAFNSGQLTASYKDTNVRETACPVRIVWAAEKSNPYRKEGHVLLQCVGRSVEAFRRGGFLEARWTKPGAVGISHLGNCKR